jgi:hypothetical protein
VPSGTGSFDRATARLSLLPGHRARAARALQLPPQPDRAGELHLLRGSDDAERAALTRAGATIWAVRSGRRASAGVWLRPFRVALMTEAWRQEGDTSGEALGTVHLVQERDGSRRATVAESAATAAPAQAHGLAASLDLRLLPPQSAVVRAYARLSLAEPATASWSRWSVAEWDLDVGSTGARLQWIRPLGPPDENGAAGGRYTAESLRSTRTTGRTRWTSCSPR